jgi:hypothetical protein
MSSEYIYSKGETAFYEFKPVQIDAVGQNTEGRSVVTGFKNLMGSGNYERSGALERQLVPATELNQRHTEEFSNFYDFEIRGLDSKHPDFGAGVFSDADRKLHPYLVSEWLKVCNENSSEKAEARKAACFDKARELKAKEQALHHEMNELVAASQSEDVPSNPAMKDGARVRLSAGIRSVSERELFGVDPQPLVGLLSTARIK